MLEKFLLFLLKKIPPEFSHKIVILLLRLGVNRKKQLIIDKKLSVNLFGYRISHPVGLAAGFDKNAEALKGLIKLNFSFIEVGTVTPKAQPGNNKPRVFRFDKEQSIFNSLGFPNKGAIKILKNLQKIRRSHQLGEEPLIGVNIGYNKLSDNPVQDYLTCLKIFFKVADYICINISSPNTPGLRNFQNKEKLSQLLDKINKKRAFLEKKYNRTMPLAIKISPDIKTNDLHSLVFICKQYNCNTIIATNTSINKKLLSSYNLENRQGGLSGKGIFNYSNSVLKELKNITSNDIKIIGVGGVHNTKTLREKISLGADAIQVYSGLIFNGPSFVQKIVSELSSENRSFKIPR